MVTKKLSVFAGFLFLVILFMGFASAQSCSIVERASCSNYIVMGLSSNANAHGELASQGTYSHVLCCDFGIGDTTCMGNNKIIGLSSETNAHAEIPENSNYGGAYDVCYAGLNCVSGAICPGDYPIEMLSLSEDINAHIGEFADYPIKICCKIDETFSSAYWADETGPTSDIIVEAGTTKVFLVLFNSGLDSGTEISFEIYEDDDLMDDEIKTITGIVDSEGNIEVEWIITQEDLEKGTKNGVFTEDYNDMVFYFKVNEKTSNDLGITVREISDCIDKGICMDYKTKEACEEDSCAIASENIKINNLGVICGEEVYNSLTQCYENTTCFCSWNDVEGCGPNYKIEVSRCDVGGPSTPLTIGSCSYTEDTTDDCEDGFLSYSWIGNWTWGNTIYADPGNEDYLENPVGEWHYDPKDGVGVRMYEKCVKGETMIPCPAQIQLPFFGVYSLVIAVAIIVLVYILISKKKKRKSKKKK